MTDDEQLTLYVGATRYYLGRMTYAVTDYCNLLIRHWPQLGKQARAIIARDVDEAFVRDDEARAAGAEYKPLGMDADRKQWERVRALWAGKAGEGE